MSKLSEACAAQPKLKVSPELMLPETISTRLDELFDVSVMTAKRFEAYLERIQTKILKRDFG